MMLSVNLYAKERRGAKLLITKKDGQQISGELIVVKPNSLLLLDTEGKDVSVGIADIKVIIIVKKSKAGLGFGTGLLIGQVISLAHPERPEDAPLMGILTVGIIFGLPLALVGGLIGATTGADKTVQIEGMTDSEIKEALDKLRKKARIRDYR